MRQGRCKDCRQPTIHITTVDSVSVECDQSPSPYGRILVGEGWNATVCTETEMVRIRAEIGEDAEHLWRYCYRLHAETCRGDVMGGG